MKLQKILLAVGIPVLCGLAVAPYVNSYVRSLPHKMSTEESASRYLLAVCPANKAGDKLIELNKKLKEELAVEYYNADALARANIRVGSLQNNILSEATRLRDLEVKTSHILTDSKYIWPENVQKDVESLADEEFRHAGWLNDKIKGNNPAEFKAGNYSDAIRRKLNLPVRGLGCK